MEAKESNFKYCEICKSEARSLCLECLNYYCEDCYKFVHDKKENSNHKKEKIDYYIPIDTKCSDHPKVPINLFCIDEKGKSIIIIKYIFLFYFRIMLFLLLLFESS